MKKVFLFLFAALLLFAGCDDSGESGGEDNVDISSSSPFGVAIDGDPVRVERADTFAVPVNYVSRSFAGAPVTITVTSPAAITDYQLSPKRHELAETVEGNTISFTVRKPSYLVLEISGQERLFIFIDPAEQTKPTPADANVTDVSTLAGIDNTGVGDMTDILQAAIDAASGAPRNIVYVPAGTYATEELYLKDNMTLYLAEGAVLKNIQTSLLSHPEGLTKIEGCSRGFIMMAGVTNAHLAGRGTIDANGAQLQPNKQFAVKIENSSDCTVDGIISRDSAFWNTLIYRSNNIKITNYKVVNNRLNNEWNETDGVDFDNCTNSSLYNAFLYTGDDCMAVKSDDVPDGSTIIDPKVDPTEGEYISVNRISHERVVCYSGSSACKVGTKTMGETMSNISFKDVDVVQAIRALVIDAVDTARIQGTVFEDIRIEDTSGQLISFNMDPEEIFWRPVVGACTVSDVTVSNVTADVNKECFIGGNKHNWEGLTAENDPFFDQEFMIESVTFSNFTIGGNLITSTDDPNANFNINDYVGEVTFVQ